MKEKLQKLEELLEVDENSLSPEMELAEIDEWDSIAKISLIVMLNDEFGKKLAADQVRAFITVQDILDFMG